MFEISIMDLNVITALEGIEIANKGKWTIICNVWISIHNFFNEIPITRDKKILVEIAPDIALLAVDANYTRALVAAKTQ